MNTHSNYCIRPENDKNRVFTVLDLNSVVILTMKDATKEIQIMLSREELIEAFEYILMKIKTHPL